MADLEKFKSWGANNLTGALAIIAGLVLIVLAYQIILSLLVFCLGTVLVYFGLVKLKATVVTDFIDKLLVSIKNIWK